MSDKSAPKVTRRHIGELRFDPKNARRHTPRNVGMIGESLQQTGAARSIVLANDDTIIAGNATVEAAAQAGFEEIIEIEVDGTQLVAVKRTDLDPTSERAVLAGLYDNRTAEFAYWDSDRIEEIVNDGVDLSSLWYADELDKLLAQDDVDTDFAPEESENKGFKSVTFSLTREQYADVQSVIADLVTRGLAEHPANPHKPGNALAFVIGRFAHEDTNDDVPAELSA
jgi:hypothetical protein